MNATQVIVSVVSVVVAAAAFYFATQSSRATAKAGVHAVDAEAYKRASEIYEDTIKNLREDIANLREDISGARVEIRLLRDSNNRMTNELRRLGKTIEDNNTPP